MWLFLFNGLFFMVYVVISGWWKELILKKIDWKDVWKVILFDLKISDMKFVQGKYNVVQKIVYFFIIVMGLGFVVFGLVIYKFVQFNWFCVVMGGYESVRVFYFILIIFYCVFFLVYVVQVLLVGWQNFVVMVCGFEVKKKLIDEK